MEKEKISVIVPVYNVEKYLPTCLDSLLGQTYQNLEIILVDDGSTDNSGKICDEYAEKDSRIQVVHQENGGLSIARNSGLEYAAGEYVSFVDSDDWMSQNAFRILYQGLKKYHAQCSVGRFTHVMDKEGKLSYEKREKCQVRCDDSREAMKHALLRGSSACNRLFERALFQDVRFPEHKTNEDEIAILRVYEKCSRVVFLDKYTYFYRRRPNSITTSTFSVKNLDFYYNTLENLKYIKQTEPALLSYAQFRVINALLYCYIKLRLKRGKSLEEKEKAAWLYREIKRQKNMAMANPHCHLWMKLAMCILSVSYGGIRHV